MTSTSRFLLSLLFALVSCGIVTVAAQDATPGSTPAGPSAGYPVAIHEGTCDDPKAEPVMQFEDATATPADNDAANVVGQAVSGVLLLSSGTVDLTFQDVTDAPYVIAVHASPEAFGTIVACGQIAGFDDAGTLAVALTPVGDSTTVGVAILKSSDAAGTDIEDGQLQASIYVFTTVSDDI
jgi:hypothetical protein